MEEETYTPRIDFRWDMDNWFGGRSGFLKVGAKYRSRKSRSIATSALHSAPYAAVDERLTPPDFMQAWVSVDRVDQVVPALLGQFLRLLEGAIERGAEVIEEGLGLLRGQLAAPEELTALLRNATGLAFSSVSRKPATSCPSDEVGDALRI